MQPIKKFNQYIDLTIQPGTNPFSKLPLALVEKILRSISAFESSPIRATCRLFRQVALPERVNQKLMLRAARLGSVTLLEWCKNQGVPLEPSGLEHEICIEAASGGKRRALRWAYKEGLAWGPRTCAAAAAEGHLKALQWLHKKGCPWDSHTCLEAGRNAHFKTLQWAHEKGCPLSRRLNICEQAAALGRMDLLNWAWRKGVKFQDWTLFAAARTGHLRIVQWCLEKGIKWIPEVVNGAASHGQLHVVRWALESDLKIKGKYLSASAAESGDLEVLKLVVSFGCPLNEMVEAIVVCSGNLKMLQWVIANQEGCNLHRLLLEERITPEIKAWIKVQIAKLED